MNEFSSLSRILSEVNKNFDIYERVWRQQNSLFTQFAQQLNEQLSFLNQINLSVQVPDIYSAIPKIDTSSLVRAFDVSNEISKLVQDTSWQEVFAERICELTLGLDALTKRLSIDFSAYRLALESIPTLDIFGDLIHLVQIDKDAMTAFNTAGWPIAPSMSRELRERVVELFQQGKTWYVSRVILGYYKREDYKNLVTMVNSWRDYHLFVPRMHIIDDALIAHRSGKYTLSVPALLPQIEGVLNDYVRLNNLSARCGKIQQIYSAAIGDLDSYGLSNWAIANTLMFQLQTNTYAFTDFEVELSKSVNNRQTTRHTVLHGVTINYHRPIHSLKAFVLLDAISALQEINENHK